MEKLCSPDWRLVGVASPFFCSNLFSQILSSADLHYLLALLSWQAVCLLSCATLAKALPQRIATISQYKGVQCCPGTALGVACIVFALSAIFAFDPLLYIAILFGGFGLCAGYIQWLVLFSRLSPKQGVASVLIGFSLGSLLRLAVPFVSPLIALVFGAVAAFGSSVLYTTMLASLNTARASKKVFSSTDVAGSTDSTDVADLTSEQFANLQCSSKAPPKARKQREVQASLVLLGILLLLSLVLSLIRAEYVEEQYNTVSNTLNHILRVLFPLLLLALITKREWSIQPVPLCLASIVLVITSLFLVNLFSNPYSLFAIGITTFLRGIALIFLLLVLVKYSQISKVHSVVVIGVGRGLYVFAQSLAMAINLSFDFYFESALALNLVYLVFLAGLLFLAFHMRDPVSSSKASTLFSWTGRKEHTLQRDIPPASPDPSMSKGISAVRDQYRLTEREAEIFALICQGRTKRHIAEMLVVSEHTIQSHVKNLYRKCGVHKKQSLINLVDRGSEHQE